MKDLSDLHLIESYIDAIEMKLEEEFIQLLYEEIKSRNLHLEPFLLEPLTY
ncbi:sporulation histidine kinase inhibitor Sda [Marinicrinis lubricantis]|uniref:Sporulation histidine kinase inhibitor Sda n=1 Tax=Marinicrinis lubricantis TaxID=2086470 RepID=A0ABW1IJ70_9BACL